MNRLRVVTGAAGLMLCAAVLPLPVVAAPEAASSSDRDRGASADRDNRGKAPPPRPIVAPEGQQQNPALREECAWLGQRIVSLLYRDDAMTGSDFVPFYLRFGCPDEHIGRAFGCVVGSGGLAENDVLADRIASCWTDPSRRPQQPEAGGEAPAKDKSSAAEKPAAEKPAAEKPAAEKPAAEKPAAEKPAAEKPAAEKPAEKPATGGKPTEKNGAAAAPKPVEPGAGSPLPPAPPQAPPPAPPKPADGAVPPAKPDGTAR